MKMAFLSSPKFKIYLALLFILALGFTARFYQIESAPPSIYPDEAVNAEDAIRANETGNYEWFYSANQGREGLMMNLTAFSFKIFGISIFALKFPNILFGTLTILGTYLLAKEIFRSERIGLISAFLVSSSFWAINFSRIAFRANILPFVLVFSFYFFFKGIRTKKWLDFLLGGLFFGIGMHTYIAFRIAPVILLAVAVSFLLTRKGFFKDYWKSALVFIAGFFITAMPMFYTFFYAHPEYLESRSSSISIMSPEVNQGDLIGTFLKSFGLSLVKYNFWGDQNWRHNFPPYPLLDPLTSLAFLAGFIFSLWMSLKLFWKRIFQKERDDRMDLHIFLIVWFFAMLAPEFMTAEGLPHALRAIGTLPVVFIFSAVTFDYFIRQSKQHSYLFQKLVLSLIIVMLASIGIFNLMKYYIWSQKRETAISFEKSSMDAMYYAKSLPEKKEKFIITGSMQRVPMKVFNHNAAYTSYFYSHETEQIIPENKNYFEIIMTDRNEEVISKLKTKFPHLIFEEKKDTSGISFYILRTN